MPGKISQQIVNDGFPVQVLNPNAKSAFVLVCEHASNFIPQEFADLGLTSAVRQSHIAWDPGAFAVAKILSAKLDCVLVSSQVSRLVYDCNRPPESPDAMREKSEVFDIPGNFDLSDLDRSQRVSKYYEPFRNCLANVISARSKLPIIVTIHSFTRAYFGQERLVELGILHDSDQRIADELLRTAAEFTKLKTGRNQPYGPDDGVTHTLKVHGIQNQLLNAMFEIRNDLIAVPVQQEMIANELADMLLHAASRFDHAGHEKAAS